MTGNPALAESFEQFLDFGTDLTIPSTAGSADINLPGELGGVLDNAEVHITAVASETDGPEPALTIIVGARDSAGDVVAELLLHRESFTSGVRGGHRIVWTDAGKLLAFELRTRVDPFEATVNFQMSWDVDGRPLSDLIDTITFMDALNRGVSVGMSPSHGPRRYSFCVPFSTDRDPDLHLTARVVKALNVIQQHCTELLHMPEVLDATDLHRVFEAATLLQGRTATATWSPFNFTVDATDGPTLTAGSRIDVAVATPLIVELDGVTHRLGQVAAFLDAIVDSVDGATVRLSPGDPAAHPRSRIGRREQGLGVRD